MANVRASRHQGRGADNGQCSNPGHNDGCHRLYKAARLGIEHLPSLVLTTAETLAIRHDAILGPPRPPARHPGRRENRP